MKLLISEHRAFKIKNDYDNQEENNPFCFSERQFSLISPGNRRILRKERNKPIYPFLLEKQDDLTFRITADYYVGIDWLIPEEKFLQVEPKVNLVVIKRFEDIDSAESEDADSLPTEPPAISPTETLSEVDYLKMLLVAYSSNISQHYLDNLIVIDWDAPLIPIDQIDDQLTPFLIVQFLNYLKSIVRKGLKKLYYRVEENVHNRVRGKIMISAQIKQNVSKLKHDYTYCAYQAFGDDNIENRFLKKVLRFSSSYVEAHSQLFHSNIDNIQQLIAYCRPVFNNVGDQIEEFELKQVPHNPFFKEYKDAIKCGAMILKRFAYNISKTAEETVATPPFWIDMPRLFELYVYQLLLKENGENANKIKYQFSTYGNHLDFLISDGKNSMVVDAKYKLHYNHGLLHQDIRQVAGYARLNKVLNDVYSVADSNKKDEVLPCLIIYPDPQLKDFPMFKIDSLLLQANELRAYHKIYKLAVPLPIIQ